ncbi:MAG: hypothetical protein ACREN2_07160 [Candidatus Dormibacteria bacterium]
MQRHRLVVATVFVAAAVVVAGIAFAATRTHAIAATNNPFESYVYDGRHHTSAAVPVIGGGSTTVTLDTSTAQVLQQNGVTVAPVAPASASTTGGGVAVSFPVTGGEAFIFPTSDLPYVRGDVTHSGGLTFSAGSKSLTVTNFIVNPGTSLLTASVGTAEVPLFELDGRNVKVGSDSSGNPTLDGTVLRLSPQAADALNATFGVSLFKEGIPVGTAHIVLMPAS